MNDNLRFNVGVALIVALGGFLMGFDASVISGVVGFIEVEFSLGKFELGWAVASLTLTATFAMMTAGPLSDRIGRRPVLVIAALLFLVSAIASALATSFATLVAARMLGGLGVGAALIIAPMYIAELSPGALRGRLVSLNQLNIVIGISAAFFSNYLILRLGQSAQDWVAAIGLDETAWRYMLGVEALPALVYLVALLFVPESPRWLVMQGRDAAAEDVLARVRGRDVAVEKLKGVRASLAADATAPRQSVGQLFRPAMKLVMTIGIAVAILQQITGINAVFFYAPMIFEQSGIGTDAAFMQAVLVGIVNLAFTVLAMVLIDRVGRRLLLIVGLAGIAVCMVTLAAGFASASYTLSDRAADELPAAVDRERLAPVVGRQYDSDLAYRAALVEAIGPVMLDRHEAALVSSAIDIDASLILFGILGFVASFAVSVGPVMWVLFSELFPNQLRGLAISFVGLINSAVSFLVQFVFPWELATLGNAATFLIYGAFAVVGLLFVMRKLPETRGRSLEELETILLKQ